MPEEHFEKTTSWMAAKATSEVHESAVGLPLFDLLDLILQPPTPHLDSFLPRKRIAQESVTHSEREGVPRPNVLALCFGTTSMLKKRHA